MESSPISYTQFLIVVGVGVALYLLPIALRPRPIPGIPYNKDAAKSIWGDIPTMMSNFSKTKEVTDWMQKHFVNLDSPIIQLFISPFGGPTIFIADFRESQDIMMRRGKEFDRSNSFKDTFSGLLPYHHIIMDTDEKLKKQKRFLADSMLPSFLNEVAAPHLHEAMSELVELWRLKTTKGQGHPFVASRDLLNMALDAIWAVTVGSKIGATRSQIDLLASSPAVSVPQNTDLPVEFPSAPDASGAKTLMTLTDSLGVAFTSPSPRIHHWFYRKLPFMRAALAEKDRMISDMLEKSKARLLDNKGGDKTERCALDNMLLREDAVAKKEGRKPEYIPPSLY